VRFKFYPNNILQTFGRLKNFFPPPQPPPPPIILNSLTLNVKTLWILRVQSRVYRMVYRVVGQKRNDDLQKHLLPLGEKRDDLPLYTTTIED
jgi:hypothetical protein